MEHTPTCKVSGCDAPATDRDLCDEHGYEPPGKRAWRRLMAKVKEKEEGQSEAETPEAPAGLDLGALREQFRQTYQDEILDDAPPIPASLLTIPNIADESPRLLPQFTTDDTGAAAYSFPFPPPAARRHEPGYRFPILNPPELIPVPRSKRKPVKRVSVELWEGADGEGALAARFAGHVPATGAILLRSAATSTDALKPRQIDAVELADRFVEGKAESSLAVWCDFDGAGVFALAYDGVVYVRFTDRIFRWDPAPEAEIVALSPLATFSAMRGRSPVGITDEIGLTWASGLSVLLAGWVRLETGGTLADFDFQPFFHK